MNDDPFANMVDELGGSGSSNYNNSSTQIKENLYRIAGLDKPVFYFTFSRLSAAKPRDLAKLPANERKAVENWTYRLGNYRDALALKQLILKSDIPDRQILFEVIEPELVAQNFNYKLSYFRYQNFIPNLYWNGLDNQYHSWLINLKQGKLGTSFASGLPVSTVLQGNVWLTLIMGIGGTILSVLIAIPIAIFFFLHGNSIVAKIIDTLLQILVVIPSFTMVILLIMLFAVPGYLPSSGLLDPLADSINYSMFDRVVATLPFLILPSIAYTYDSIAVLSRFINTLLHSQREQKYYVVGLSKGLSIKELTYTHLLSNALLPLFAVLARNFPLAFSGSIVIETMFNLPGMGRLLLTSISFNDYPVIMACVLITAFFSCFSYWLANDISEYADPRLRSQKA